MNLFGSLNLEGMKYFLILNETKQSQTWYLMSEIRKENFAKTGLSRFEGSLSVNALFNKSIDKLPFLIEAMKQSKTTGKISTYGNFNTLNRIFKAYLDCKGYGYADKDVSVNIKEYLPLKHIAFKAKSETCSIDYEIFDNHYTKLSFSVRNLAISLTEAKGIHPPTRVEFRDIDNAKSLNLNLVNLDTPDVKQLGNVVDLSWYKDPTTNKLKKEYVSIRSILEFESKFMTPMIRRMNYEILHNIRPVIACDTETTGLKIYNLDKDNPDRDRISTIQFSWRDNQGVIIYLDMEYHENVPKEYVFTRLKDLFDYHYKKPKVTIKLIYDENGNPVDETYTFNRKDYDLTGHNTIFDGRVTLSEGCQFFFNHDTLQMLFDLDPVAIKRNKGLKKAEKFFFNETPPELADLLGKGNEGMFRYLKDDEVARIYGCADVDYSRKLFFALRDLMLSFNPEMYKNYRIAEPFSWYLSAQIEYYGNRMDMDKVKKQADILRKDIATLEDTIFKYVGSVLKVKLNLGMMEETPSYIEELSKNLSDNNCRYEFKFSNKDLGRVLYKMLEYPILARTKKGNPAINSEAMQLLLLKVNKEPIELMKEDIMSSDGESILVKKDEFNKYKYPVAYLLQQRSSKVKEYDNYYAPFEKENTEDKLFKRVSTTNIETKRISCPVQTVKKNIKVAILPYSKDYYHADWDFSSVEPRIFVSEAGDQHMIKRLDNPENDYHTENAALMFNKPAYAIDPDEERRPAKVFGLSIPYDIGDYKLAVKLHTIVDEQKMVMTRTLKSKFMSAQKITMAYLEGIRNSALTPREVPLQLKRLWGMDDDDKVGLVFNRNKDYRYFNLTKALGNKAKEASIRRQAGNFPIQSFAAFFFKRELERLHRKFIDYGLEDKIIYNMVIHDELLFSIHKSVDPRLIMKIVKEALVVRIPNHTTYYVGLNFGENWYDCKSGAHEIPSLMLLREAEKTYEYREWTDKPNDIIDPMIKDYKSDRMYEVIDLLIKEDRVIDPDKFIKSFTNYTVRGYIMKCKEDPVYSPKQRPTESGKIEIDSDDLFFSLVITLMNKKDKYNDISIKTEDGLKNIKEYIKYRNENNFDIIPEYYKKYIDKLISKDMEDKLSDDINDEDLYSWTLDEEEDEDVDSDSYVNHVISMYNYSNNSIEKDEDFNMDIKGPEFRFIKDFNNSIVLKLTNKSKLLELENIVKEYKNPNGVRIRIETPTKVVRLIGTYSIDKIRLEKYLGGV